MTSNDKSHVENEFCEIDSKGEWLVFFQHIRSECSNYDYTAQEARKVQNMFLNRYRDVSPYDHSRVVLSKGPCDYINANLVRISKANRRYILTQGPLSHTTGHFWLMVWEQNCKAVLMLNRIIEKKQEKCHKYWPEGSKTGDDEIVLEDVGLKVQYLSEKCASYYTIRMLRLIELETGKNRDILHFHYTTWPDFGVPQSPMAFLDFLMVVRQSGALSPNVGPPVVHCSAGIGRSGTFCLVDSCLVLIEENGVESVNVCEILLEMRKYRMGLIQTADQLRFSYLAIIEGLKRLKDKNFTDEPSLIESFEVTRNHVSAMEIDFEYVSHPEKEEVDEQPPPPPPPRGESLKPPVPKPFTEITDNGTNDDDVGIPPDKPLPAEPSENPSSSNISTHDSLSPENSNSLIYSEETPSVEDEQSKRSLLRQRKQEEKKERKDRIMSQLQEMKRKQELSENKQDWKKALFNPVNIGVGVGILLGGGIIAYVYYSNKL